MALQKKLIASIALCAITSQMCSKNTEDNVSKDIDIFCAQVEYYKCHQSKLTPAIAERIIKDSYRLTTQILEKCFGKCERTLPIEKTPLHLAIESSNTKEAELLIKNGADVNVQDSNGKTPLHYAAESKLLAALRFLLSSGANIKAQDKLGNTPLHYVADLKSAAVRDSEEIAQLLIEAGADVNAQNKEGQAPLHTAINIEIIRSLLTKGAHIDIQDNKKQTPLHRAAEYNNPGVAEFLISNGANINIQDQEGNTPLHYSIDSTARSYDSESTVKLLLNRGADVNIQNNFLDTPLHLAVKENKSNIIALLISHPNVNISLKNNCGHTALDLEEIYR